MNMTEHALLLAFLKGPMHGYAAIQIAGNFLNKKIAVPTGYRHIYYLENQGLVTKTGKENKDDPRRVMYRLTKSGQAVLETQNNLLNRMTTHVSDYYRKEPVNA